MGFLENNETMAWLNQAGGGCPCQYAGCTDPAANNYNASASVDDGSCTYPQISCYKCVGSSLVGNNFNGPSCPGGWNAYPMSCAGGGGPVRNFSGDYYNAQGNNTRPNRGIKSIYPPPMDGRKVQAGGRLSARVRKGDTDPTDDMFFTGFSGNGFTSY